MPRGVHGFGTQEILRRRAERAEVERDALREKQLTKDQIEAARRAILFAGNHPAFPDLRETVYIEAFEALGALLPTHPKENP